MHEMQDPRSSRHVDEFIGERIRQRRVMLGLTQEHLAVALGISYQQVQKYETGANRVSAGRLYEIARCLGIGVSHFFDGLEEAPERAVMPHGGHNRGTIDLVRNFRSIPDADVRHAVSNLIRSLTGH